MDQVVVYIKLPLYIRQWCETHYGRPCEFSDTHISRVIRYFSRLRPEGAPPERQRSGELAVVIPGSQSKKPSSWNYFSPHGKKGIADAIESLFVFHLWEDMHQLLDRGCKKSSLILDWMDKNGISHQGNNYDNLRMKIRRLEDAHKKYGVNVSRGYKHENR